MGFEKYKELKGRIDSNKLNVRILNEIIDLKTKVKILTDILEKKGVTKEEIATKYAQEYDNIEESVYDLVTESIIKE